MLLLLRCNCLQSDIVLIKLFKSKIPYTSILQDRFFIHLPTLTNYIPSQYHKTLEHFLFKVPTTLLSSGIVLAVPNIFIIQLSTKRPNSLTMILLSYINCCRTLTRKKNMTQLYKIGK